MTSPKFIVSTLFSSFYAGLHVRKAIAKFIAEVVEVEQQNYKRAI